MTTPTKEQIVMRAVGDVAETCGDDRTEADALAAYLDQLAEQSK